MKLFEQFFFDVIITYGIWLFVFLLIWFLHKSTPIWSKEKRYDRLLTILSSFTITSLFVIFFELADFISKVVYSIFLLFAIIILMGISTTYKVEYIKKTIAILGYSVLVSSFFLLNSKNFLNNQNVNIYEFKKEIKERKIIDENEEKVLDNIIEKFEKEEIEKRKLNEMLFFIIYFLGIFGILFGEKYSKSENPCENCLKKDIDETIIEEAAICLKCYEEEIEIKKG